MFYEEVEFAFLSENKFNSFIEKFDFNEMTANLWRKLKKCFKVSKAPNGGNHKKYHVCEYKGQAFSGIIQHLTNEFGGNVDDKGVVKVTSSSCNSSSQLAKFAVDLDDSQHYFASLGRKDSWIEYDFINRKVIPTHYSIRTSHDHGKNDQHPKNWCIEGSNDEKKWISLDSRNNVECLNDRNMVNTFNIQTDKNEGFRYLRMRQTGPNTYCNEDYYLILSALEYFGTLIEE